MSTDLSSFENPSVLLFCFAVIYRFCEWRSEALVQHQANQTAKYNYNMMGVSMNITIQSGKLTIENPKSSRL